MRPRRLAAATLGGCPTTGRRTASPYTTHAVVCAPSRSRNGWNGRPPTATRVTTPPSTVTATTASRSLDPCPTTVDGPATVVPAVPADWDGAVPCWPVVPVRGCD